MGHMLATVNPAAAQRIEDERLPMPRIGETVVYHPRHMEVRQGRTEVPAIVSHVDVDNRRLELHVMYHSDNIVTEERVPEWVEGDRGWSRLNRPEAPKSNGVDHGDEIAALKRDIAAIRTQIYGEYAEHDKSLFEMLDTLDGRLGALEERVDQGAPAQVTPAKPKRSLRGHRAS